MPQPSMRPGHGRLCQPIAEFFIQDRPGILLCPGDRIGFANRGLRGYESSHSGRQCGWKTAGLIPASLLHIDPIRPASCPRPCSNSATSRWISASITPGRARWMACRSPSTRGKHSVLSVKAAVARAARALCRRTGSRRGPRGAGHVQRRTAVHPRWRRRLRLSRTRRVTQSRRPRRRADSGGAQAAPTRARLRSVPEIGRSVPRLTAIPGTVPGLGSWPAGCRFAPRCPLAKAECREKLPGLIEVELGRWVRCPFGNS